MDIKQKVGAVLGSGALAVLMVLVPHFEGLRYPTYQDSVGVWTICYGHTRGVYPGMQATQARCDAWLEEDIKVALEAVDRNVKVKISETMRAALGDFVFNLGEGALRRSTLLALWSCPFNSGHVDTVRLMTPLLA